MREGGLGGQVSLEAGRNGGIMGVEGGKNRLKLGDGGCGRRGGDGGGGGGCH